MSEVYENGSKRRFRLDQLIESKRFKSRRVLLKTLLKDDELYTADEVEEIIENFMKKVVF